MYFCYDQSNLKNFQISVCLQRQFLHLRNKINLLFFIKPTESPYYIYGKCYNSHTTSNLNVFNNSHKPPASLRRFEHTEYEHSHITQSTNSRFLILTNQFVWKFIYHSSKLSCTRRTCHLILSKSLNSRWLSMAN